MSDKKVIADDSAPVELEAGQVIINKKASKKHWRELSKINQSAGGGLPIHEPQFKNGGGVRSQKQYNKEETKQILKEIANYLDEIGCDVNEDYIEDGFVSISDRVSANITSGYKYDILVEKIRNIASELRDNSKWKNIVDIEFEKDDEWFGFRVSLKRQFNKGGGVRSQKQYNKEVDAYKWFVVDLSNKRAISGWEFKSDANDSLKDYDGDKNFKVVSERALTSIGVENPKERFKKMKNGGSVDDKIYAPKGYVFAKLGSNRTREKVKKAEAKYVSVWTFGGGQGMAGSSTIFLYEKDYNKIKNITGVSKSTNYLRANSNHWFARDEDDNLRKVFKSIHQKYEQGGDMTINFTYEIGGL